MELSWAPFDLAENRDNNQVPSQTPQAHLVALPNNLLLLKRRKRRIMLF